MNSIRKQVHLYLIVIFIAIFFNNLSSAQDITLKHLSANDGLSNSYVNCLLQDRAGFIWFGTDDGLNRFDGYNIKVYRNDPEDSTSISDNIIWALFEDKQKYIWIGTKSGGVNKFDPISEKFEHPNSVPADGIRHDFYLEPQVKENQVIRLHKLIFEQGKSYITADSYDELNKLVNLMNQNSSMQIQLEGHTDYRGSKKMNQELSEDRVKAVKNYIVGKGIHSRRVKTKAFGGSQPLVRESSIAASKINRRVEVRILKL